MPRSHKKKKSKGGIDLIGSARKVAAVADRLAGSKVVAFDTEFLWERSYAPRLGLIQIADLNEVWLIDPVALSKSQMEPLLDLLTSPATLKVAHAIDQDQLCLHHSYGVIAEPVLDTAVAAALLGMGDQIGLSKLLARLLGVTIDKGYTRTNWLKRPLSPKMLTYAAGDVRHLTKAAQILTDRLKQSDRFEWALDLSARLGKAAAAQFEPESLALKIATDRRMETQTFGVFKELISWREGEASRRDLPRKWLAEDKILIKLAMARPRTAKQLEDFRGLGISNRPRSAAKVLRAIRRGIHAPTDGYVRPAARRGPTPKESAALVVLRCFLNAVAADKGVPLRLLVDSDRMVELLRGKFSDVEGLRKSGILNPRAVDLVGEDIVAILNGRRGLRLVNGVATHTKN